MAQLHFGDEDARRALADVDRFPVNTQGEGHVTNLGDAKDSSFNPPPQAGYGEPPLPVHHQRTDPLTAGKPPPVVSTGFEAKPEGTGAGFPPARGYEKFVDKQEEPVRAVPPSSYGGQLDEAKPEGAGEVFPPARGYGKSEDKQEEPAVRDVPPSGYGGQPNEGYTSLGVQESQDSENSRGAPGEEVNNVTKEREGTAPYESISKELEDHPAGGGIATDVPPLKKESLDFPKGDTDDLREREAAPQGYLRNAEQPEDREAGGDHVDISNTTSSQEPTLIDDLLKSDSKQEPKLDEPISEGGHADTSLATTQIKSPVDDPKQEYAVDDPTQDFSADDTKQDYTKPDSSEQDFSELSQELGTDGPTKEEASISDHKIEYPVLGGDSLDDVKKPPADPAHDDSIAGPTPGMDGIEEREAAPQAAGLLGKPAQQDDQTEGYSQRSFENSQKEGESDVTSLGAIEPSKDELKGKEGADPDQAALAAEPEAGSRGVIDVDNFKEEPKSADDPSAGNVIDEPIPQQTAIATEEAEGGFAPGSRGITDVDSSEASIKEPTLADDSIDVNSINEPIPHQPDLAEEPEGASAQGTRGIVDVQPVKEDHVDFSEVDAKEPIPADVSKGGSITNEPTRQPAAVEVPEGGYAPSEPEGITDVQSLKGDYVDFSQPSTKKPDVAKNALEPQSQSPMAEEPVYEADTKEPISAVDSKEGSTTNEPTSHQPVVAEVPEGGSASEPKGMIDVHSLKEDYVDKSEPSAKDPIVAENALGTNSQPAMVEELERAGGPKKDCADASEAAIEEPKPVDDPVEAKSTAEFKPSSKEPNVAEDSVGAKSQSAMVEEPEGAGEAKEDFADASEVAISEDPKPVDDPVEATSTRGLKVGDSIPDLKEGGPTQISPVDDPERKDPNAGYTPASSSNDRELDLAEHYKPDQPEQPQATDEDLHGCERFQGDDGKEKIKAEGYNIYSGKPENKVYDAVDVIGDEHEKPIHETEADVAVAPCEDVSAVSKTSPEALGKKEDAPEKVGGFDIQEKQQARDVDTDKEPKEPSTEHVSSGVEEDVGSKADVKDANTEDASPGLVANNVPAEEVAREFPADEREQEDVVAEVAKPDFAEASSTDDVRGFESFQGDDGKEKVKAEGYNIYTGEPESKVYDAANVFGDEHEKPTLEAEADVAVKPHKENLSAEGEALPEALGDKEDVLRESGSDIPGNEQAVDLDTREEHDEHAEPFTEHARAAPLAVEQDAGLKVADRDFSTADVEAQEEAENVPAADKKGLEIAIADLKQDESAERNINLDLVEQDDAKQTQQAEKTDGSEYFQGEDGRRKVKAEGSNIYSGEPETTVYDEADVIGDQHEKLPREDGELKDKDLVPGAVGNVDDDKPSRGRGFDEHGDEQARVLDRSKEHDESVAPPISTAVEQEAGFKPDVRDIDPEDASKREDVANDKKSPFTDVFKIETSGAHQGLGFEPDSKDTEDSPAVPNKEVDAVDREGGENRPGGEEFPNTEFARTDDHAKTGSGAAIPALTEKETFDTASQLPSERLGQEEERRPTDEHPLDKPPESGNVAEQDETFPIEVPKRPPTPIHPHQEDTAPIMNRKPRAVGDDEEHHEAGPHEKKGIFAKIKEKLSPSH